MPNKNELHEVYSDINDDDSDEMEKPRPKKKTLGDLLELMRKAEDDLDNFDLDLDELGTDIRSKIDNIVEYLDYCDEKASALKMRMKLFEKKAKAYENKSKYLKQYVATQLAMDTERKGSIFGETEEKPCVSGDVYQLSLQYHDFVKVNCEADPIAFLKLGPQFIERRYFWNKRALKMALESNSELIAHYAELKKRPHIKIDIKT